MLAVTKLMIHDQFAQGIVSRVLQQQAVFIMWE